MSKHHSQPEEKSLDAQEARRQGPQNLDSTEPASCPALVISGAGSNQGKTTITAALAYYYRKSGKRVRVFKVGPDFLDPMILETASGNPVYQLDLWMAGEENCRRMLHEAARQSDLILIEGVMGLFDGMSSTADLARLFDIPVLAVIKAEAMAETFHAVAHGLATYDPSVKIAAVIANAVGSKKHAQMLQRSAPQTVPYLGAIERSPQLEISSRHLGLRQACEIEDLERKLQFACERIEPLLNCLPTEQIAFSPAKPVKLPALLKGIRIAIARDLAFSFIYRRNLEVLSGLGADITFFSPLEDSVLPDCDSIYLPGGYPELHLARLCANVSMKESIKNHFQKGQRIYAECGGMLYLLERLVDKTGTSADMVGLIPGEATMGKSLTRLAYQYLESGDNKIHGHTFHYSISEIETVPCSQALHPFDKTAGEPAYRIDGLWASYVHLYFDSNPLVAASFFTAHTN